MQPLPHQLGRRIQIEATLNSLPSGEGRGPESGGDRDP